MTTTSTTNKVRAQGNGVTTVFPAAIKIFSEDDIEVTIITRATNVVEKTLVLNDVGADGYTLDFNTEDETVTVTVNTAPTITQDIQQFRILSQTQETSFPQASKFPSDAVENALDKTIMILQDQQEALGRALKVSPSSSITQLEIPDLSGNAGRVLVPSASEDGFEYRTILNTETITNFDKDVFSGTGAQTEFVLSQAVSIQNALEVFVDNVRQEPAVDFTATGTTLTFMVAPDAGTDNIYTIDSATSSVASVPADASVTTEKLYNGAVTNEKMAAEAVAFDNIASGAIGSAADIAAGTSDKLMSCEAYETFVDTGLSKIIGIGQTWTDMSGSRALDTVYTNATGRPIQVVATIDCLGSSQARFYIDGNLVSSNGTGSTTANKTPFSFIIPNDSTYEVRDFSGTVTISQWVELR